jgi:hypothetical protein
VAAIWRRRAVLIVIASFCIGVAAVLAGVALMLWAVIPAHNIEAPWALLVAPALPALLAMWCLVASRAAGRDAAFEQLRQQWKADLHMLRETLAA